MTYEAALAAVHAKGTGLRHGETVDLKRICRLLAAVGNPQKKCRCIHIAGTNGKGSTAVFCAEIFRAASFKTGLFVSPFVVDFCERIQINGQSILPDRFAALCERVLAEGLECTEFELICAIAFLYYAEEHCDMVVLETGLGGRLDATNACEHTVVSVITAIGLDHCAVLGNTLEAIAAEKCGIIKNDITVTSPRQPAAALQVITDAAQHLFVPDLSELRVEKSDLAGNDFTYRGETYHINLCGIHQIENALVAIETVHHSGAAITAAAIKSGLCAARNPARLEVLRQAPPMLLDGAHNAAAARVLIKFLQAQKICPNVVVGMMRDKATDDFLRILLPCCGKVFCVPGDDSPRALPAERLAEQARKYAAAVTAFANQSDAVSAALCTAEPLLVTGSLHLCGALRPFLLKLTEIDN